MIQAMPTVRDCEKLDCQYNKTWRCSAALVTVGHDGLPTCNTYKLSGSIDPNAQSVPEVGDCAMHMCLRNRDLKCIAYSIKVRDRANQPQCVSFKNRYK